MQNNQLQAVRKYSLAKRGFSKKRRVYLTSYGIS